MKNPTELLENLIKRGNEFADELNQETRKPASAKEEAYWEAWGEAEEFIKTIPVSHAPLPHEH